MQRNPEQMPITADCQSVVGPPTPRYSEYFDTRFRKGRPVNQTELADFLRKRREALQPEDVGLQRGARRRASGLRREEVAELAGMSTDYYSRLEFFADLDAVVD